MPARCRHKLLPNDQVALMPHLEPFAIRVRSAKAHAFMPVKLGKYELESAAPLHATFGMCAIRREAHVYKAGSREPYQEC